MLKTIITTLIILIASIAFADITPFISIGASSKTEHNMSNPLGSIGFEYRNKKEDKTYITFEHISSIRNNHDYGINLIGLGYKAEIISGGYFGYLAANYHDKMADNNDDYGDTIQTVFMRAGVEYKGGFIEIFDDRVLSGMRIRF